MPAGYASANALVFSATKLTTVDLSTGILAGYLATDGTTIGDPDVATEELMMGDAAVGASAALTFRVLGSTPISALTTAKDATPPSPMYAYVVNRSGTSVTRYGPGFITAHYPQGNQSDPKRRALVTAFSLRNDTPEDMMATVAGTVILPSA